jgi:hypothetical protein
MPSGGARPGAGRKKGSKDNTPRRRMIRQKQCLGLDGVSPLDVLITHMRKAWSAGETDDAVKCAIAAAPYVHPRLANTNTTLDDKRSAPELTTAELERIASASRERASETQDSESEPDRLH